MKQSPILFSTAMVQAILDGRKTMTRREVKAFLDNYYFQSLVLHATGKYTWAPNDKSSITEEDVIEVKQPFGEIGDLLWVREEHKVSINGDMVVCEYKDGAVVNKYFKEFSIKTLKNLKRRKTLGKWQRGRFLPKDLSRLWLEKTDVDVERLKDISEDDAKAEGVLLSDSGGRWLNYRDQKSKLTQFIYNKHTAKQSFLTLWEVINGRVNLHANPWVWAISFKVLSTTGKPENI